MTSKKFQNYKSCCCIFVTNCLIFSRLICPISIQMFCEFEEHKDSDFEFVFFLFCLCTVTARRTASVSGKRETRSGGRNWRSEGRGRRQKSSVGSGSERKRRKKKGKKRRRPRLGEEAVAAAAAAAAQMMKWMITLSKNPRNLHLPPSLLHQTLTLLLPQRLVTRTFSKLFLLVLFLKMLTAFGFLHFLFR